MLSVQSWLHLSSVNHITTWTTSCSGLTNLIEWIKQHGFGNISIEKKAVKTNRVKRFLILLLFICASLMWSGNSKKVLSLDHIIPIILTWRIVFFLQKCSEHSILCNYMLLNFFTEFEGKKVKQRRRFKNFIFYVSIQCNKCCSRVEKKSFTVWIPFWQK